MSHSKAAASPVQNLEITLAPSTPKRGTKRGVEAGEDAETPNAMRRTCDDRFETALPRQGAGECRMAARIWV